MENKVGASQLACPFKCSDTDILIDIMTMVKNTDKNSELYIFVFNSARNVTYLIKRRYF